MSRIFKIILVLTSILLIFILGFLFLFNNFFELDEGKILTESRKAFANHNFESQIISKLKLFDDFSLFLLNNADSLVYGNQSDSLNTFNMQNGQFHGFKKNDDCFTFILSNDIFLEFYTPTSKIDSLKYFINSIGTSILSSFQLCTNKDYNSVNKNLGNIRFNLTAKEEIPINPNYYLRLYLSCNKIEGSTVLKITNINESLQKDTLLSDQIKYIIRIDPYAGM